MLISYDEKHYYTIKLNEENNLVMVWFEFVIMEN